LKRWVQVAPQLREKKRNDDLATGLDSMHRFQGDPEDIPDFTYGTALRLTVGIPKTVEGAVALIRIEKSAAKLPLSHPTPMPSI